MGTNILFRERLIPNTNEIEGGSPIPVHALENGLGPSRFVAFNRLQPHGIKTC